MSQSGTGLKRNLFQKMAEFENYVTLLGAFLRCAQHGPTKRLAYFCMVSSCCDGGALLYVPLGSIES